MLNTCRRSTFVELSTNSSIQPVDQNLRYATVPSSQGTSQTYAQVGGNTRQEDESAPDYSMLGPAYATVDQGKQEDSRFQISSNVCERCEFAEIHNMETDRQDYEDENYSHLQH